MRILAFVSGVAGLTLLLFLLLRTDLSGLTTLWRSAGFSLLWLVPYRGVYFLLYALGWRKLLSPFDAKPRAGLAFLWWVSSVREAIDRLLPVASVGGAVIGVRLLRWRGIAAASASATVIVEVVLTLVASYLFAVVGVLLLLDTVALNLAQEHLLLLLVCTLPVPVACFAILRHGKVFSYLQRIVGLQSLSDSAAALDRELRSVLRRGWQLLSPGILQLAALISASLEIWFVMRLFKQPISFATALMLESATQAVRHLAFFVPGGLGVQEAGLILFGGALGIGPELALSVSFAKRLREVLCGVPALISWQWVEARRLRRLGTIAC